ncbi:hypothetical protein NMY3_00066 [Candidatus Nitrosocosmicus oleophilus]|uniref:Uncharacterized protein n=1 Tax=Candidatus Nitrosocosmicus oleophilus TaxID=1353260 RepID=A0A654LTZ4_9ARCH|nr:hypothetical protein [Candidatus Nitrosocosmicus oleophilus]ALI34280.1 hypothetical protein NMY3_00066 [Candidatus Nitrosocosmicus oleophilus]
MIGFYNAQFIPIGAREEEDIIKQDLGIDIDNYNKRRSLSYEF